MNEKASNFQFSVSGTDLCLLITTHKQMGCYTGFEIMESLWTVYNLLKRKRKKKKKIWHISPFTRVTNDAHHSFKSDVPGVTDFSLFLSNSHVFIFFARLSIGTLVPLRKSTVWINKFLKVIPIYFNWTSSVNFLFLISQGGSPDAGKERKRQQDLENNYNLVWNEDELQTVPREDDEADGEVEVESF